MANPSPTASSSRRGRRALRAAGIALAGAVALLAVFGGLRASLPGSEAEFDPTWERRAVERRDLSETIVATGMMEPAVRVPVISEVSGIIARVRVEEGDRVERGQVLFELDRERLEARVAQIRAELAVERARTGYDLSGRARAELAHARRILARTEALSGRRVVPDAQLDDARHAVRLAEIAVTDALAEEAARRAAVARTRELLRQAERDLANAELRAPIQGVVIERSGEVGRAVADVTANGGTIVAVIADDTRLRLVAEVDENDIARVAPGQDADVTLDAFPGERFEGRVHKISSAGTSEGSISNFEVEITLPRDARLRVGMSSDARVVIGRHRDVLLVPNRAIVRRDDALFVRIPDVGEAEAARFVPIEIGYSDGFHTVVSTGLDEGDVVFVPRAERG